MNKWEVSKWGLIHTYRAEFMAGAVPWIDCPDDLIPLRVVLDKDDDPALRCDGCQTVFRPGTAVWELMRKNLDEVFVVEHVEEV